MPDITISTNKILKLLGNLKTDKAAGRPDEIKPIVLKELRNEIAPVIQNDWKTARVSPLHKKR